MIGLITGFILAIVFSYAALQNSQPVNLQFQQFTLSGIPLYLVVITAMLIGAVLALIIGLAGSISTAISLFSRDRKLKTTQSTLDDLENKIHGLELENARLRASYRPNFMQQSSFSKPNFLQRLRHRLSS